MISWCKFSASKIIPSSCDRARSLVVHGVPPRILFRDSQLCQWDEDRDGGKAKDPRRDGVPQTQASFLTYHSHPHPRQSRPVDWKPFRCVPFLCLPLLTTPPYLDVCSCFCLHPMALQSALHTPPGRSCKATNLVTSSLAKNPLIAPCGLQASVRSSFRMAYRAPWDLPPTLPCLPLHLRVPVTPDCAAVLCPRAFAGVVPSSQKALPPPDWQAHSWFHL